MLNRSQKLALFMEGAFEDHTGKMGIACLRYSQNPIVCIIDRKHSGGNSNQLTGIDRPVPVVATLAEAIDLGAEVLILGIAPPGGLIPESWNPTLDQAVEKGLSLVNGLHDLLGPRYPSLNTGQWIWDVRVEPSGLVPGTGAAANLSNRRVLTIGTDMSIGKMTSGLEITKRAREKGVKAEFVATGQIGITITGRGIPLDAIRVDFAAGALEREVMSAKDAELIVIEGQGSLLHAASSATLPLIRGSMPTHFVLCHKADKTSLARYPEILVPPLRPFAELYESLAEVFGSFPKPITAGICLNTSELGEDDARRKLDEVESETGYITVDPVRFGVERLLRRILDPLDI